MNPLMETDIPPSHAKALETFQTLCEEALGLAARERRAMADPGGFNPVEFDKLRESLLPKLESALIQLRARRQIQRQTVHSDETASLFQSIQSLVMKFLQLDRENQQSLLRRGMVPARHLPTVGAQQPHFVAGLYRQHTRIGGAGTV